MYPIPFEWVIIRFEKALMQSHDKSVASHQGSVTDESQQAVLTKQVGLSICPIVLTVNTETMMFPSLFGQELRI